MGRECGCGMREVLYCVSLGEGEGEMLSRKECGGGKGKIVEEKCGEGRSVNANCGEGRYSDGEMWRWKEC